MSAKRTEGGVVGWYYQHENGSLIYKPGADAYADIQDSDFVRALWPLNPGDRATAWRIVVEAGAGGADAVRVAELANLWKCSDLDAARYAEHLGARLYMDGDAWCATRSDFQNLQESPAGFGETAREAFAELAKELGYKPQKMWGASFEHLVASKLNRAALAKAGAT